MSMSMSMAPSMSPAAAVARRDANEPPRRPTPPHGRRSSAAAAAHGALGRPHGGRPASDLVDADVDADATNSDRDGNININNITTTTTTTTSTTANTANANINRWSQSTASSTRSHHPHPPPPPHPQHLRQPSASRTLTTAGPGGFSAATTTANGAAPAPAQSPTRTHTHHQHHHLHLHHQHHSKGHTHARSPPPSPRRTRPRAPSHGGAPVTGPPRLPSLPPLLLPSTSYDGHSPASASTANSPSTAGLFSPSILAGPHYQQPLDYFNSTPPPPPNSRPPDRSKAERVLGKSPLPSPGFLGTRRPTPTARRPSIPGPLRETAYQPPHSAAYRTATTATAAAAASRDHLVDSATDNTESARSRNRNRSRSKNESRSRSKNISQSRDRRRNESTHSAPRDDSLHETPPRVRERREKDKKAMLSRALQKANTAVLLDNAQNFEGAMEAYEDACKLLQNVMTRSSQDDDRRKLDAIRVTYTNRIEELKRLDPGYPNHTGKSLPARPMSGESLDEQRSMLLAEDDIDEAVIIGTATMTRIIDDQPIDDPAEPASPPTTTAHQLLPLRKTESGAARESVISTAIRDVQRNMRTPQFNLQPPPGKTAEPVQALPTPLLASPMDRTYMPPPLSPKRSASPLFAPARDTHPDEPNNLLQPQQPAQPTHKRAPSTESTSWLDTIEESGASSCSSSVHSLSPGGLRRKHIRTTSGGTEAEFDAALDAAVEAAYDEGFEPFENDDDDDDDDNDGGKGDNEDDGNDDDDDNINNDDTSNPADLIAARLRNVELAKERVREAEREEAIAAAKYRFKETQLRNDALPHVLESAEVTFETDADEEERLLDEITREYMLDGFDFDLQTKSALPRQSDSSGFSGSMYGSSVSSHRTTGGTSLSTVAEVMHPTTSKAQQPSHSPPAIPAPSGGLPALPPVPESRPPQTDEDDAAETTPRPSTAVAKDAASVRSRRLSGQNAKLLKIETSIPSVPAAPHTDKPPVPAKNSPANDPNPPKPSSAAATFHNIQASLDSTFKLPPLLPASLQTTNLAVPSPQSNLPSPADTIATVSPATPALNHGMSHEVGLVPGSPKGGRTSALGIRKNKSSLSLKQWNLSISSPDGSEASVGTPLSTTFSMTGRKPSNVGLSMTTPSIPTFNVDGLPSGGMHLFESDIHSALSPGSPSPDVANAPIPLEPCPEAYLLRPFWLMRCFYQTIAHPRGGYLSTKLFIPRDVWRVKGVKLKNVEDKIANCDLLTAALQKLASVDTFDADAILDEMQSLELVLDQVQAQLAKKLGNEVGVHSVATLFKDATTTGEGAASMDGSSKGAHGSQDHTLSKSAVAQGKSYLTSWRKLRSKNSGVNLVGLTSTSAKSDVSKDSLVMATLPMTSLPTIRFAKREISSVVFEGPNSGYMGSLARLFDSVQVLDQITRQVEDPGLKHSSPTHVGLELSARHAAEFFGFYICRFVLADVTMMLDKFIKRGSEWVLQ